jgi:spore germination cell wall hydrolase CwlJ-like protein
MLAGAIAIALAGIAGFSYRSNAQELRSDPMVMMARHLRTVLQEDHRLIQRVARSEKVTSLPRERIAAGGAPHPVVSIDGQMPQATLGVSTKAPDFGEPEIGVPDAMQAIITSLYMDTRNAVAPPPGTTQPPVRPTAGIAPLTSLRPVPRGAAPGQQQIEYSLAWLDKQPRPAGDSEWECLTEALYFEARGESVKGQFAVAEVILNRVRSRVFPNTVCAVVNQGTGKLHRCQFSYNCDGKSEAFHESRAYTRAGKVARILLDGGPRNLVVGATFYHTRAVSPNWSRQFIRTASIGSHYFYRNPKRVSRN